MAQRTRGEFRQAYQREYYENNKTRAWERNLKWKYGITPDDYYRMLAEQDGGCAICAATECSYGRSRLCVDHDHTTGAVRGLLCTHCNRVLGLFNDKPELFDKAAEYLRAAQKEVMSG